MYRHFARAMRFATEGKRENRSARTEGKEKMREGSVRRWWNENKKAQGEKETKKINERTT